jgi:hypothetical protein
MLTQVLLSIVRIQQLILYALVVRVAALFQCNSGPSGVCAALRLSVERIFGASAS